MAPELRPDPLRPLGGEGLVGGLDVIVRIGGVQRTRLHQPCPRTGRGR